MATINNKRRRDSSFEQLPTSEEWTFRIKVISSATDLHNDVFREAVRGLARICFPDGILEQLGQRVVEEHMREEHANTANIRRMSEVFKSEMVQRLTGMLSAYDASIGNKNRDNHDTGVEEPLPRKKRKCRKTTSIEDIQRQDALIEMDAPVAQDATSTPDTVQQRRKDKKVSSTWAWDVDSTDLADIGTAFPRTADLFAYHASPIARQQLGSKASRKELRLEIQSMLDALPQDEFDHWIYSLELLQNGDRTMLVRSAPSHTTLPRMTPAPGKTRPVVASHEKNIVKQEATEDHVSKTSPTVIDGFPLPVLCTKATIRKDSGTRRSESISSNFDTPVLQLLLGTDILTPEQCLNNTEKTVATVMENFERRISAEQVFITTLSGQSKVHTKMGLHGSILSAFSRYRNHFSINTTKYDVETALLYWVVAVPEAFPELKTMPIIFTHALPCMTPTINLLFGSWPAVSELNGSQVWEMMLDALRRRGISEASLNLANVEHLKIVGICNNRQPRDIVRRAYLERLLRHLAFVFRDKFPDLKGTPLVKAWEEQTGLTW